MPTCLGVCVRYKTEVTVTTSPYLQGKRYCGECAVWMGRELVMCPCCGGKLRTAPRNRRYKKLYVTVMAQRRRAERLAAI